MFQTEINAIPTPRNPNEEDTVELLSPEVQTQRETRLILEFGDQRIEITSDTRTIHLGRDPSCPITLGGACTSRIHASIRRSDSGLFYVHDSSTNGTIVLGHGTGASVLRRGQSMPLSGLGYLGLGAVPHPNSAWTLRFRVA